MLTRLAVTNLTVFAEADFRFVPGLNVVVGENGTGKSHVLKAAYTLAAVLARGGKDSGLAAPTKSFLETALANKLRGVFRPEGLGRLARRQRGVNRCDMAAEFSPADKLSLTFHTKSTTEVTVGTIPKRWEATPPAFLPTRELLSLYPNFVSLYDQRELEFEETWRDTCSLLGVPPLRGRRAGDIDLLLEPLEDALGGTVVLEDGRFYVKSGAGKLEAHLVAEGLRKLATVAQLVVNGSLTKSGSLFWDEPEANLNPKTTKRIARTIVQLAQRGVQVTVATHSLFLLRELDILLRSAEFKSVTARFFGLHRGDEGVVTVQQGNTVDDIGQIDALDEELQQSDRFMAAEAPHAGS